MENFKHLEIYVGKGVCVHVCYFKWIISMFVILFCGIPGYIHFFIPFIRCALFLHSENKLSLFCERHF